MLKHGASARTGSYAGRFSIPTIIADLNPSPNEAFGMGEEGSMGKTARLLRKLANDEEGAALVEYTVLLGIMLVAVVATIGLVGGWVNAKWTALWTALSAN
jgi:pilus assembly protein Flp/PilA